MVKECDAWNQYPEHLSVLKAAKADLMGSKVDNFGETPLQLQPPPTATRTVQDGGHPDHHRSALEVEICSSRPQ